MRSTCLLQSIAVLSVVNQGVAQNHLPTRDEDAAIAARLQHESPMAVRKMSNDPEAMFFPSYWGFSDAVSNSSIDTNAMQPAVLPIFSSSSKRSSNMKAVMPRFLIASHGQLQKRAFTCPSGTNACTNINRADACCPAGLTCNLISNTGAGDVGCCAGTGCSGQLASCPAGYTECTSFGGGCCIPGYECVQGGCMAIDTRTVVVPPPTPSTTTRTTTSTPPPPPTTTSSPPSSTIVTTTVVVTTSTPSPTTTSTLSSSASIEPPARPTSASPSTISSQLPLTTVTPSASFCPTGFYQCSAYYNTGACCQVGRDCALTNCPAATPQTIVGSNGVTVVAPAGAVTVAPNVNAAGQGKCAQGWYGCAASVGGDCCPTGFNCGTASCWLNATAQATGEGTPKEKASGADRMRGPGMGAWLVVFGGVMVHVWGIV